MKLRFRHNSLRLRVNRREVEGLSTGHSLREQVQFPGDAEFTYVLERAASASPEVQFNAGVVRVALPAAEIENWASTDAVGVYFELPANGSRLKVAVEKDLECVDGAPDESDPDAYPRSGKNC
jgi:hypothetical protein